MHLRDRRFHRYILVKEKLEKAEIIKTLIRIIGRIRSVISVENRDTQNPTVPP